MKNKDPKIFLIHILESIEKIEEYIKGFNELQFSNSTGIQDSVVRRLEIIGEAVKQIPNAYRNKYSEIPWKQMAGVRDILIHEYFGVDMHLVWKIVKKDIPKLKKQIIELLEKL